MVENKVKFSIQNKFFVFIFSIIVFICSTLVVFYAIQLRSKLYKEIEKRGETEAKSLAYDAAFGALTEDEIGLGYLIAGRMEKADIVYILVIREDGSIISGNKKEGYFFSNNNDSKVTYRGKEVYKSILISDTGEKVYEFTAQIESERHISPQKITGLKDAIFFTGSKKESLPSILGVVKVGISLKNITKEEKQTILISVVMILIVATIALIISYYFVKLIVAPIRQITEMAVDVAKGNLQKPLKIKSSDEVGQLAASFNKMTIDLSISYDELITAKDYTENIIQTFDNLLLVVNPDSKIKTVNKSVLNLLGYKENELIGKPINMVFKEECEDMVKKSGIDDLIKKGCVHSVEKTFLSKTGRKIPGLFSCSTLRDKKNSILAIVCVAQDITELKQVEKALRASSEADQKKTAELIVKSERIERFQKLTVNREFDIIRLKREVNDLLVKYGQSKKYKSLEKMNKF